jgi:hypothetical protein
MFKDISCRLKTTAERANNEQSDEHFEIKQARTIKKTIRKRPDIGFTRLKGLIIDGFFCLNRYSIAQAREAFMH